MSTQLFASLPPFPNGLPEAEIATISLARLMQHDDHEAARVLDTCRKTGFFILDLQGDALGERMVSEIDEIFVAVHDTMQVDDEEKKRYLTNPPQLVKGYKLSDTMKHASGQRDPSTFFQIGQDDLLGNVTACELPPATEKYRPVLKSYVEHSQTVLSLLLTALARQLGLPEETFRRLQPTNRVSGTVLRMIRYEPGPSGVDERLGLLAHTDFGTMTLLANVLGGLQVLDAEGDPTDQGPWRWVRPQPGCLIVNVGDEMVEWTGGVLRSNMHRVVCAPGEQRHLERLSFALLVRAFEGASMERIRGGRIPSVEEDKANGDQYEGLGANSLKASDWEAKKAMALINGSDIARSRGGRPMRAVAA